MERRPDPRDYKNNPPTGWTPQSARLGLMLLLISSAGLLMVYWISNG